MESSVGLILAKSDSKRLPHKNIIDFMGKPMFLWNVEKCLEVFDKVYVSSDSMDILNMAKEVGAIPVIRPKSLCGDTPNIPCYQHAQETMQADIVIAVHSCSPNIGLDLLKTAKDIMEMGYFEELMTCHPIEHKKDYHNQAFKIYGSIWALTKKRLKNYKDFYKPTPEILILDTSEDIHTKEELEKAKKQWL